MINKMYDDLDHLFQVTVPKKFDFLVSDFGFTLNQDKPWRFIAYSPVCHVVMEYEKNHFGCWIEKCGDRVETDLYKGISVELIAVCKGFENSMSEPFFGSPSEIILREIERNSKLLRDYCSAFLLGDFSEWSEIISCIKKEVHGKTTVKQKYINNSILHGQASNNGNYRAANRAYHELSKIYQQLSKDKDFAELFLKEMLQNEDLRVQVWAATHSLGLNVNVNRAIETLESISCMEKIGIIRLSAEMVLKQWKNNTLILK